MWVALTEVGREVNLNDRVAGQRVGFGKEVKWDGAGVGVGVEGEGGPRKCCGRYVGCITHLQLVELAAVAEDVGSDEGERVREVCAVRIKVVAGYSGMDELASGGPYTNERWRSRRSRLTMPCLLLKICYGNFVLDH